MRFVSLARRLLAAEDGMVNYLAVRFFTIIELLSKEEINNFHEKYPKPSP